MGISILDSIAITQSSELIRERERVAEYWVGNKRRVIIDVARLSLIPSCGLHPHSRPRAPLAIVRPGLHSAVWDLGDRNITGDQEWRSSRLFDQILPRICEFQIRFWDVSGLLLNFSQLCNWCTLGCKKRFPSKVMIFSNGQFSPGFLIQTEFFYQELIHSKIKFWQVFFVQGGRDPSTCATTVSCTVEPRVWRGHSGD